MTDPDFLSGFYHPAEWETHRATWLSWPHNTDTWPGGIESIFDGYLHFIEELSKYEKVCIVVGEHREQVTDILKKSGISLKCIEFYEFPTNDAWCRDHGPSFLVNEQGKKVVINWEFNAWGDKYPPFELDNEIPGKIATSLGLKSYSPGLVLEGGSVEFNGQGTLLTTTSCLLNPNRNPGVDRDKVENTLRYYFGVEQILWLDSGIAGDDTDGHIDTISRFVNPSTVVTVTEEDQNDVNYCQLKANLQQLQNFRLLNGDKLDVVTLPMPGAKYYQDQRLPASYANFYICNGAVLVPTYRDPNDAVALSIISDLFKGRKVVGVDCLEIIRGLGALHCLCMQEPD